MNAKWGTLLSCSMSCFVAWLDFAIVNTALPPIENDLSASLLQLQWVMNAFMLSLAVLIVTLGRLSDQYGRQLMNNDATQSPDFSRGVKERSRYIS